MKFRNWLTPIWVLGFAVAAWGQQSTPTPAKPADSGPTLAATMQFIQEKLTEQGQFGWTETYSNQPDVTRRYIFNVADVMADPGACTLYTTGTTDMTIDLQKGKVLKQGFTLDDFRTHTVETDTFSFKQVEKVTVEKLLDVQNQVFAEAAHPDLTATVTPIVFVVKLWASNPVFSEHTSTAQGKHAPVEKDANKKWSGVVIRDEETTNKVAKAMTHAMELCGGGVTKKDLF